MAHLLALVGGGRGVGLHAVEDLAARQGDAALPGVSDVAAADRVGVLHAAQDRVGGLRGLEDDLRALAVVAAEVADPVLAEDLLAEPELPVVAVALVALIVLGELALEPLEAMGGGAQAQDRAA